MTEFFAFWSDIYAALGPNAHIWLTAGLVTLLLVLSGFFSGSETALTAANVSRIHHMVKEGNKRASTVKSLLDNREHLIGAILLGNNLVNNLSTVLATSLLLSLFGDAGMVYATLGMTFLVLVFSEVLPKTYAIKHHDAMAMTVAPIMRIIVIVLTPFTKTIYAIVRGVLLVFGTRLDTVNPDATAEILRGAIDMHGREALSEDHSEQRSERHMLGGVLDLAEMDVEDIMIHRQNMVVLDVTLPPSTLVQEVLNSPYTRMPLYRDETENIVGVLHAKDLLRAVAELQSTGQTIDDLDVTQVMSEPWYVPETTPLTRQLSAFREKKQHFALVIDEYGALMGLVTLEDIIEEIVGEIDDEFDEQSVVFEVLEDGGVLVDGSTPVRDLNRAFDWELPDDDAATVAGMVIHMVRLIPTKGQVFNLNDFTFTILESEPTRVTRLRIDPPSERDPEAA